MMNQAIDTKTAFERELENSVTIEELEQRLEMALLESCQAGSPRYSCGETRPQ